MTKRDTAKGRPTVRFAALGDLHCTKTSQGNYQSLFAAVNEAADALLLCGDLTDYGLPEEAQVLARELAAVRVPVVAVLGNHDYESGQQDAVREVLQGVGVTVLDGEAIEIHGVGIAGAKGFAGGFGRFTLGSWGEAAIKSFVREALDEALKLEAALARLRTPQSIALLHYAPIRDTVEGEPAEIMAFLGNSRLEEPLQRHPVSAVLHGHAHGGSPEGRTVSGVPVYNVSMPVMNRHFPDQPPFRVLALEVEPSGEPAAGGVMP
ncbi:Icc-related predicted phosphoesterase [Deinobacterium chartae]|uniref:Icc-related predicted phosphoesterase n=1 Tax=Deinobacterium chartae TaxID=521158 RepID=A0A841HX74_9DEIO|nr:metallophosphoesterase [Deinobacterium chartae]MBB6096849.1 Icc-related predicted phosphoesterase [Deinobacterium chartae]